MNESALGDVPLADLPAYLLEDSGRRNGKVPKIDGPIVEGDRHDALVSLAGTMRRRGMDEPAILAALRETNKRCVTGRASFHPLPDEEVRSVAASAKWEPEEPVGSAQPATAPAKTVAEVVDTFKRWLYLPEPDVLLAVLGTVAANHLPGEPVWLVVVGPPGGGKTEPLRAVTALPDAYATGTLTESSLLSGSPKRERPATAKGGLLRDRRLRAHRGQGLWVRAQHAPRSSSSRTCGAARGL